MYLKLMIDGVASDPFSAIGLPPLQEHEKTGNREKVIRVSRERYSMPKAEVEEKIIRWSGVEESFRATAAGENQAGVGEELERYRHDEPKTQVLAPIRIQVRPPVSAPMEEAAPRKKKKNRTGVPTSSVGPVSQPASASAIKKFSAVCTTCGKTFQVGFNPDPTRPVYCDDCWKKQKGQRAPLTQPVVTKVSPTQNVIPAEVEGSNSGLVGSLGPARDDIREPPHSTDNTVRDDKLGGRQPLAPGEEIKFD